MFQRRSEYRWNGRAGGEGQSEAEEKKNEAVEHGRTLPLRDYLRRKQEVNSAKVSARDMSLVFAGGLPKLHRHVENSGPWLRAEWHCAWPKWAVIFRRGQP